MTQAPPADLDALRDGLSLPHRTFVNSLWSFYRDHNQWVPSRIAHQHFGKAAVQAHLDELGTSVVRAERDQGRECYRLTFLGVLLTDRGVEAEDLLIRYLEYVRDRYRSDPSVEWVGSQEVEAALHLPAEQSRFLRQLIRLSHWWGGGSAFGEREWAVGVPVDVDELATEADLRPYVRQHVLRHFPIEVRSPVPGQDDATGGPFWFVGDASLKERLAADWHEAQDVCHVRGWKSCVILCGGVLEAILTYVLARDGWAPGRRRPGLADLAAEAATRRLIQHGSLKIGTALRMFQTLSRAGHAPREAITPGRTDADAALDAVRTCLRQLGQTTPKPTPQAGR